MIVLYFRTERIINAPIAMKALELGIQILIIDGSEGTGRLPQQVGLQGGLGKIARYAVRRMGGYAR